MKPVLERADLTALDGIPIRPQDWTAVVPAAGKGTRLGFAKPKILYPIGGRPILAWLEALLVPWCRSLVAVVSPKGRPEVERAAGGRWRLCVQQRPLGMADAVWAARSAVQTPYCLVVWGDQVGLRIETVRRCLQAHAARPNARLTLPTRLRARPYTHLVRDARGRLTNVRQAREGPVEIDRGENDAGLFLFHAKTLFSVLAEARREQAGWGGRTGEFNLLSLLPRFEQGRGSVVTLRIVEEEETVGVNTEEEAKLLEDWMERAQ